MSVPLSRYVVYLGLAIGGCALDLWTKRLMFDWLGTPPDHKISWVIDGFFGFETTLNQGALFGIGQGHVWLFATLSIAAAIGIFLWLFVGKAARDGLLTFALGGITGGILGNLYDRLGLWGGTTAEGERIYAVRDWILFRFGSYTWPNFNIADMLLVGGAGLLILHAFLHRPSGNGSQTDGQAADDQP